MTLLGLLHRAPLTSLAALLGSLQVGNAVTTLNGGVTLGAAGFANCSGLKTVSGVVTCVP